MLQEWSVVTIQALQSLWRGFLEFVPNLLAAIVVFIIGLFVSCGIERLVVELLNRLQFNKLFGGAKWKESLEKAELKITPAKFVGAICKWVLVIVFLLAAVEILGAVQFTNFLQRVVLWLPNVLVAVAIFVVAVILADFLEKIFKVSVKRLELKHVEIMGAIVRWAVYIFAALAILLQLGVTPTIINSVVIGLIATISLALGLSFGLGGKDIAAELLQDLRKKIKE